MKLYCPNPTLALLLLGTCLALSACRPGPSPQGKSEKGLRIVGSSTVYPFATKVAQEYGNITGQKIVVEATGSGGGHKLFCESAEPKTPDIVNSSRRQKKSEFEMCKRNGVSEIIEVKVGSDGIVFANALDGPSMDMRAQDVFMALAKNVPLSGTDCTLHPNPYTKWTDINPDLPPHEIETYGPPPTSGTRDAFVEIAMEAGAMAFPCLREMSTLDRPTFDRISHTLREDGKWIDGGENDNALVQTLVNTPTAVGVFGFSFLDQNADKIKGAKIDGAAPLFENIASGEYPVSRSMYIYLKKEHTKTRPGIIGYALEFTSDQAVGPGGYLEEFGLVPVSDQERAEIRKTIKALTPYTQ